MIKYVEGKLVIEFRKSVALSILKYLIAWPVVIYGLLKKCMDGDNDLVMVIMGVITILFYVAALVMFLIFTVTWARDGRCILILFSIAWAISGTATATAIRWRQACVDEYNR